MSVLIFSSCSKIPIKNAEWFLDYGEDGADSFWTFGGVERELTKEQWDKERAGMMCTLSENYTNQIAVIETFCRQYSVCEKEFKKKMKIFKYKIKDKQILNY